MQKTIKKINTFIVSWNIVTYTFSLYPYSDYAFCVGGKNLYIFTDTKL